MAIPTRAEVDTLVRDRLASDPTFREKLVSDPRGIVSQLVGVPLPEAIEVKVHEESLTDIHLVIPAARAGGELADAELELVAGGGQCWEYNLCLD